jgi:hypothetical protein
MKGLISCKENPKTCIEVRTNELFIDKKVIFDEKIISVSPPSVVCRLSANFNLDTSPFQVKVF